MKVLNPIAEYNLGVDLYACKHPPCQHAQGVRLAEDNVRNLFTIWLNEGVPYTNPADPETTEG